MSVIRTHKYLLGIADSKGVLLHIDGGLYPDGAGGYVATEGGSDVPVTADMLPQVELQITEGVPSFVTLVWDS